MGRWGSALHLLLGVSLLVPSIGCATTDWNQFWYGNPQGFMPHQPVRHTPQFVWSNAPYSRFSLLTHQLSQVTPQRWVPIYLAVGTNSCPLCTSGDVIYVNPWFLNGFSDVEVMGALAHEMAHGDLGHIGRAELAGEVVTLVFQAVAGDNMGTRTTRVHNVAKALVVAQFSQAQEKEADRQAAAYLDGLGYDGRVILSSLLSRMQGMGFNQWPSWFSSHPSIPERIASLQQVQIAPQASAQQSQVITQSVAKRFCPVGGELYAADIKFCPNHGVELRPH